MRITLAPWGETLAELVDVCRRADRAGVDTVWVPEMHRSAPVAAAAVALATERTKVGTAIALSFTRSPMTTALESLDVDELSGGRFVLGLGSGVKRLNEDWHNARWGKPVPHMRETIRNVRAFWAGCRTVDPIQLEGEFEPMSIRGYQRPFPVVRDRVPVYLAAMAPLMMRLAGETADGWLSHELSSPAYVEQRALPDLAAGLERAGRSLDDLDVVVSACCSISDDEELAVSRAAGLVGFYASVRTYADFFDFHGFADEQQRVVDAFRSGAGADHLAAETAPEMTKALTLVGSRDEVAERLHAYDGIADSIKLSPPTHGLAAADTRAAQDEILALLESLDLK